MFDVAIRKVGARPEDTRFERVAAANKDHARTRALQQGLVDPHIEEIIGVEEVGDDEIIVEA